jgi:TrmH family RNA methyltransferase
MPSVITSAKNETIKSIARLKRTRERRQTGSILVEGPTGFDEALKAGFEPTHVLATESDVRTRTRLAGHPAAELHLVSDGVLGSVADALHPRSPVFVMPRPTAGAIRPHNTVVLAGVSDPGNAGTIVRTAAALGWDVAYTPDCVDMWSPKTLRAGAGAHFRSRLSPVELDEDDSLADLTIVATVVSGGAAGVDEPGPYALLVGSEPRGLEPRHLALASHRLTIDMVEAAESLNVSVASAIAMYMLG